MFTHAMLILSLLSTTHPFALVATARSKSKDAASAAEESPEVHADWLQYLGKDVLIKSTEGSAFVARVLAIEPAGVTCQLVDGSSRQISLDGIESIEIRESAESGGSPTIAATDDDERLPESSRSDMPRVRISTTRDVPMELYEVTGQFAASGSGGVSASGLNFRAVCAAPCNKVVDASEGQSFFIRGDKIPQSNHFKLYGYDGDIELNVRPGRRGLWLTGIFMASASIVPVALSIFPFARKNAENERNYAGGVALIGVGVGLLVVGIVMAAKGSTKVKVQRRGVGRQRSPLALRWG